MSYIAYLIGGPFPPGYKLNIVGKEIREFIYIHQSPTEELAEHTSKEWAEHGYMPEPTWPMLKWKLLIKHPNKHRAWYYFVGRYEVPPEDEA